MERGLKNENFNKVVLGEDLFTIDANGERLFNNSYGRGILPYNEMLNDGKHFHFNYNKRTKQIVALGLADRSLFLDHVVKITLPLHIAYQQNHSIDAYDAINLKSKYNSWGFSLLGNEYEARMRGIKPSMIIVSDIYEINITTASLCNIYNKKTLRLQDFEAVAEGGKNYLEGYYDAYKGRLVGKDQFVSGSKPMVVRVRLPAINEIDPVGTALAEGKQGYAYLNRNPSFHMQNALIKAPSEVQRTGKANKRSKITRYG